MGPEGSSERRLCAARAPPSGEAECVWSVLHLQKHGTGPDISYQHAEVPDEGPQPPLAGNHVVVLGMYTGTHKATGKAVRAQFAHVWAMRGQRVLRFQEYTD